MNKSSLLLVMHILSEMRNDEHYEKGNRLFGSDRMIFWNLVMDGEYSKLKRDI